MFLICGPLLWLGHFKQNCRGKGGKGGRGGGGVGKAGTVARLHSAPGVASKRNRTYVALGTVLWLMGKLSGRRDEPRAGRGQVQRWKASTRTR